MNIKIRTSRVFAIAVIGVLVFSFSVQEDKWRAPTDEDKVENPVSTEDVKAIEKGKKIFEKVCWTCHGMTGQGDGPAAVALDPSPKNFTSTDFTYQSDGAIFWKLSTGRGQMAPYKDVIPEADRWKVVSYIRTLKND